MAAEPEKKAIPDSPVPILSISVGAWKDGEFVTFHGCDTSLDPEFLSMNPDEYAMAVLADMWAAVRANERKRQDG